MKKILGSKITYIIAAIVIVAVAAVLLFMPGSEEEIDETLNLLSNWDFEQADGEVPAGWGIDRWFWDEGVSTLKVTDEGRSGGKCLYIENIEENDARFTQTVSVRPNSIYRISCYIKAEDCDLTRNGAGISAENTFISSEYVYDTEGEWTKVTLYGETGPKQTSMTVYLRIGGYGSLCTGRAWFDDAEMVRLKDIPAEAVLVSFATNKPSSAAAAESSDGSSDPMPIAYLVSALFIILVLVIMLKGGSKIVKGKEKPVLIAACIVGVVVRCILAVSVRGFEVDVNCFEGWAYRMAQDGWLRFYDSWCDYPPGYMILLYPIGKLQLWLGIEYNSAAHWLLVKLIPIACDVLTGLLLYHICKRKENRSRGVLLSCFCILNPAVIFNSAVWGQVDTVMTLVLLLAVYYAVERKWYKALIIYGGAILIKPQALMFGPVGIMLMVSDAWMIRRKEERTKEIKTMLLAAAAAIGAVMLVCLPFALGQNRDPLSWLIHQYTESLGEYNYLTVNACNLMALLGKNWKPLAGSGVLQVLGWMMYGVAFVGAGLLIFRGKRDQNAWIICAAMLAVIFMFGVKMHERYIFPILALLMMAYIESGDIRILGSALLFSCTLLLNSAVVMTDTWITTHALELVLVPVMNLIATGLCLYAAVDIVLRRNSFETAAYIPANSENTDADKNEKSEKKPVTLLVRDASLHMKRIDYILMALITAAYSVLAFTNLGSTKAPQTAWKSSAAEDSVIFELEEKEEVRVTYYGGICNSAFTLEFSDDGEEWSEPETAAYSQGDIFRWIWFSPQYRADDGTLKPLVPGDYPMQEAKYIRLTPEKAGLILHEVAFLNADGEVLNIRSVTGSETAGLLIDEQDTVPEHPSYYNSSYFDEIYHARTGYEFANNLHPYENTHPPLGKVFIMLGIELFGMTPFGWRFFGTLFGVLMLPVMYLLIKQLLKKTEWATMGTLLLALDSMHFTQTRIATIDTYGVFFILLMYLFMLRYVQMNFYKDDLKKTLIPLGLCGISMGLGIASKWIDIYAVAGLVVLLAWSVIHRAMEYNAGCPEAKDKFWKNSIITGVFCVVMFIIVPLVIYYFSYYWFMKPSGGLSISKVWNAQLTMFNYHSGLGADNHFFASPWYEWPLIIKPMWYYSGSEFVGSDMVSSISCMGNPAVWWTGLAALILTAVFAIWNRYTEKHRGLETDRSDLYKALFLLIGFASQYMPWMLVTRSMFIYHYFASVPFIILCVLFILSVVVKKNRMAAKVIGWSIVACALVLFAAFYPLESGLPAAREYVKYLRWFNWYNY